MTKRIVFAFLLLFSLSAEAGKVQNIASACRELANRDPELTQKCISHVELFELGSDIVKACTAFHPGVEERMKALKSGADINVLRLCKKLGWNLEHTLSCMRSYPTPRRVKACKKIGGDEEMQLDCIRSGRDSTQVEACISLSPKLSDRLACLERGVPTLVILRCSRTTKQTAARFQCIDQYALEQERQSEKFLHEARDRVLAEENERNHWPAKRKSNRMPASVPAQK